MKIGFFDSGVGGLSVVYQALKKPELGYEFIYYADRENAPYSYHTEFEIKTYVFNAIDQLIGLGCEVIVLACNTATSVAVNDLRDKYDIPIVGMEPAIKPAVLAKHELGNFTLVTATPVTLKLDKFKNLVEKLNAEDTMHFIPLPKLVEFAEATYFDDRAIELYIRKSCNDINFDKIDNIVLGCTHFPFFKRNFKNIFGEDIPIFDGIEGTLNQLIATIPKDSKLNNAIQNKLEIYESGKPINEEKRAFYKLLFKHLEEECNYE